MGKQNFAFRELNSSNTLRKLARAAGLRFSGGVVHGNDGPALRHFSIETGLHLRIWDFTPVNELQLLKKPSVNKRTSNHLFFLISPKIFPASSILLKDQELQGYRANTVMISASAPFHFKVLPQDHLKAIDISFDLSWLRNAFKDIDGEQKTILNEFCEGKPVIRYNSYDFEFFKHLSELHNGLGNSSISFLRLRSEVLRLVSEYFQQDFSAVALRTVENQPFYYNRILQVEKLLQDHVCGSLPSLPAIAQSVALSESTLKRQFKQIHRRSIYEYYLKLKMQYAIQLLNDESNSVNEVAGLLDYEKVSCFIGMFKKHYGISPGLFRKQRGINAVA